MKRLVVKLSSLVTLITIFVLPLTISASAASAYDKSDFAFKTIRDNSEIVVFDNQSLNLMSKRMRIVSDQEKFSKVMEECNISNAARLDIVKNLANNFDAVSGVSSSTEYVKVDKNGNQTVMNKADCLKAVAESKNNTTSGYTVSDNGYMQIATVIIQVSKDYQQQGRCVFLSGAEWLKEPAMRVRDAYSIGSRFVIWDSKDSGSYEALLCYDKTTHNYSGIPSVKTESKDETFDKPSKVLDVEGFFFELPLPGDIISLPDSNGNKVGSDIFYSNITCTIGGWGRVNLFTLPQQISVTSRYVHMQLALDIGFSFEWAIGSGIPGVVATGVLSFAEKAYDHYMSFEYFPNI